MRQRILAPALGLAVLSLAGCDIEDWHGSQERHAKDFQYSYDLKPDGRVAVEGFNGAIEVSGWDQAKVDISGTKYGPTPELVEALKIEIEHRADSVHIRAVRPSSTRGNMGVKFAIKVPRRAQLERIVSTNGSIRVLDAEGPARVKTTNGAVRAQNLKGAFDAQTSNGSIEVMQLAGSATLRTSNGRVRAEDVRGTIDAVTSNGSINVKLDQAEPGRTIRLAVFGVLVLLTGAGVTWTVVRSVADEQQRRTPTPATTRDQVADLGTVLDAPHIVFRSTALGPTYGTLTVVPLSDPGGGRASSGLSCERVHASRTGGICLQADRGMTTTYRGLLLDAGLRPARELALSGEPVRTRMSADGSRAASTVFVSGHSYATVGFVTEAVVYDIADGRSFGNLEKEFTTFVDGEKVTAADLNVWGVTFPPGSNPTTFYATVATGGRTWLARGDLTKRTLTALVEDAECPSVSPDGRKVAYKKRAGSPVRWRFHVLDLQTMKETAVAEKRSVDDQVEWLDDDRLLYGLPREGTGESDVWVVPADGTGAPAVLVPDAWSPAVVR